MIDWGGIPLEVGDPEFQMIYRPLGYERVYLPLYKVADTPFHIQGDDILLTDKAKVAHSNIKLVHPMLVLCWANVIDGGPA